MAEHGWDGLHHAVYLLLLARSWTSNDGLPDGRRPEDGGTLTGRRQLHDLLGTKNAPRCVRKRIEDVLAVAFVERDGRLYNPKLEEIRKSCMKKSYEKSQAARKRWSKRSKSAETDAETDANALQSAVQGAYASSSSSSSTSTSRARAYANPDSPESKTSVTRDLSSSFDPVWQRLTKPPFKFSATRATELIQRFRYTEEDLDAWENAAATWLGDVGMRANILHYRHPKQIPRDRNPNRNIVQSEDQLRKLIRDQENRRVERRPKA